MNNTLFTILLSSALVAMLPLAACDDGGSGDGDADTDTDTDTDSDTDSDTDTDTDTDTDSDTDTDTDTDTGEEDTDTGTGFTTDFAAICAATPAAATLANPLIDDVDPATLSEQADGAILPLDDRLGYWYCFNDGSTGAIQNGMATPAPPGFTPATEGADGTTASAHTDGSGFTSYGAGMGVSLYSIPPIKCPYDATAFDGIQFWAKGHGNVKFMVSIPETQPEGSPNTVATCVGDCTDPHAVTFDVPADWTLMAFTWDQLIQGGWGTQATFDPAKIVKMQWQFGTENTDFELFVDELAFYTAP